MAAVRTGRVVSVKQEKLCLKDKEEQTKTEGRGVQ